MNKYIFFDLNGVCFKNNATADYEFLLRMFNKRNKDSIREWEHRKIKALLVTAIIPHLRKQIKEKRNAS